MLIAFIAIGALVGLVYTSGYASSLTDMPNWRPATGAALQWAGLVTIGLAVAASGTTFAALAVLGAAAAFGVFRTRSATILGFLAGAVLSTLSGASMEVVGAAYARFSTHQAVVLGVVLLSIGVLVAPYRRGIAPMRWLFRRIPVMVADIRTSGARVSVKGIRERATAARTAAEALKARRVVTARTVKAVKDAEAAKADVVTSVEAAESAEDTETEDVVETVSTEAKPAPAKKKTPRAAADEEILAKARRVENKAAEKKATEKKVEGKSAELSADEVLAELEKQFEL